MFITSLSYKAGAVNYTSSSPQALQTSALEAFCYDPSKEQLNTYAGLVVQRAFAPKTTPSQSRAIIQNAKKALENAVHLNTKEGYGPLFGLLFGLRFESLIRKNSLQSFISTNQRMIVDDLGEALFVGPKLLVERGCFATIEEAHSALEGEIFKDDAPDLDVDEEFQELQEIDAARVKKDAQDTARAKKAEKEAKKSIAEANKWALKAQFTSRTRK